MKGFVEFTNSSKRQTKKHKTKMRYRRTNIKGGTYFFTVNLQDRRSALLVEQIDVLRTVINKVKQRHRFKLDAMVVLPEHLHALWTLPADDHDFSTRWMLIKSGFSRQIPKHETINTSRQSKGERGIWQRRYWEHCIRDQEDYEKHVDYIHYNPVKHGYVKRAVDWPFSTIHEFIKNGVLNSDWGYSEDCLTDEQFGEPRW